MIVGSIHLYKTARPSLLGAGKAEKVDDLARIDYAGDNTLEVIGTLRVLLDTLEERVANQEAAKSDNPAEKPLTGLTGRQRRSHLIEDEDDEDED